MTLAANKEGEILALRDSIIADQGAYLPREGVGSSIITALMLPGPYKIKNVSIHLRCVLTNKTPSGALRGFGHPEACFVMERMMDALAIEIGADKAEDPVQEFHRARRISISNGNWDVL